MLAACRRPAFLQSWQYAEALLRTEGGAIDLGLIRFSGKPVGLVQVRRRGPFSFLSSCRIHRGPAWIYDEIPGEMLKLVLHMLRRRYHLLAGRPLLFHPELPDTPANRRRMREAGFFRRADGYRTRWLDLTPPPETLRAGLRANWRASLDRAMRHGLEVEADADGRLLDWLMEPYLEDRLRRGYEGPSPAFLKVLYEDDDAGRHPLILRALDRGRPIAGILLVRHGTAATYQVGWTSDEGRRQGAHHLLLWGAVLRLKAERFTGLDLGGIPPGENGIGRFKEGLGGEAVDLVGGYV